MLCYKSKRWCILSLLNLNVGLCNNIDKRWKTSVGLHNTNCWNNTSLNATTQHKNHTLLFTDYNGGKVKRWACKCILNDPSSKTNSGQTELLELTFTFYNCTQLSQMGTTKSSTRLASCASIAIINV